MTVKKLRRAVRIVVTALLCIMISACGPREVPRSYRVGILSGLDFFASTTDGFKAGMAERGYIEGRTITYSLRRTNFDPPREREALADFVTGKVDLVLAFPTEVSLAAKSALRGSGIPLVFANANIEGLQLVDSVRKPGGMLTGVRYPGPDIALRRLEILHEMAPRARRIWVPYQEGYPTVASEMELLRSVAGSMGVTLLERPARTWADAQADIDAREKQGDIGIDAVLLIPEPLATTRNAENALDALSVRHGIPVGGAMVAREGAAAVFGLATDNVAVGRQAATLADKIFRGTPAGTIPVLSAESYLQINYRAARRLHLEVDEGLLKIADKIVR